MATHDYVIDNSTGANVRADINNALAAIVSNNSNSSSPSTTYAYQWWADTSANVLKIRNSANNAWIELLQLDGTLTLEDGSASTPALAFRDDLNTGIYSSAADTFNVATGGVERMELGATTIFNEDGADVDFRIEGDTNANLFYVDAGNDAVGIGTSSPLTDAELTISANDTPSLAFQRSGTGKFETAIAIESGHFHFKTGADSSTVAGLGDVMKIESTGNVGVGTTSPSARVHSASGSDSGVGLRVSGGASGGTDIADFRTNNGTIRMKINNDVTVSTGNLVIGTSGKGIDFSATSDSNGMSAEVLDDYETGTWTPVFKYFDGSSFQNAAFSNTPATTNAGLYTKIGNMVHIAYYTENFVISGAGVGQVAAIDGLPYTHVNGFFTTVTCAHWDGMGDNENGFIFSNSTQIRFTQEDSIQQQVWGSGLSHIMLSASYRAA